MVVFSQVASCGSCGDGGGDSPSDSSSSAVSQSNIIKDRKEIGLTLSRDRLFESFLNDGSFKDDEDGTNWCYLWSLKIIARNEAQNVSLFIFGEMLLPLIFALCL